MADQQAQDPVFQIQRVYMKEASLEQPNSPAILLEQEQPTVDIQLGVEAQQAAEGMYEVAPCPPPCTTKIKDKTVFLVEVKQAGIFEIRNVPARAVAAPSWASPARRSSTPTCAPTCPTLSQRAGFPPVHLAEINFQAMYEQQQAQLQQGQPSPIITTA
jgi:preprotein translocase subunit SecB